VLDLAIILARFVQFASVLVVCGSSLFYIYGFELGGRTDAGWRWREKILLIASVAGFAGTIVWVMAETAYLSGDLKDAVDPASLWYLLAHSRIGGVYLLRGGLLAVSFAVFWIVAPGKRLWVLQAIIGAAAVASFAWSGHGARDNGFAGALHLAADVTHLLTAALWVGALVPLSVLVTISFRSRSDLDARMACYGLDAFSGIGLAVVAVLVLSGIMNSWFLIGLAHWRGLFTTAYGVSLLVKLGLFGLMLILAAANRLRFCPSLNVAVNESDSVKDALRAVRTSVLMETALALSVLAVVAVLGTLEPPVAG
jgi:copper resistance protein D